MSRTYSTLLLAVAAAAALASSPAVAQEAVEYRSEFFHLDLPKPKRQYGESHNRVEIPLSMNRAEVMKPATQRKPYVADTPRQYGERHWRLADTQQATPATRAEVVRDLQAARSAGLLDFAMSEAGISALNTVPNAPSDVRLAKSQSK